MASDSRSAATSSSDSRMVDGTRTQIVGDEAIRLYDLDTLGRRKGQKRKKLCVHLESDSVHTKQGVLT